jgi:hypothetical protein
VAGIDLRFTHAQPAPGGPVELVFGVQGGLPVPPAQLQVQGRITGARWPLHLHTLHSLGVQGCITGMRGHIPVQHNINVQRPLARLARSAWQQATPAVHAVQTRYEQARPLGAAKAQQWQRARPVARALAQKWQQARALQALVRSQWQQGRGLGVVPLLARFEQAAPLGTLRRQQWQQARPLAVAPVLARYEQALALYHLARAQQQQAQTLGRPVAGRFGVALPLLLPLQARYEQARRPGPGVRQTVPPKPPPCYSPTLPVALLFHAPAAPILPVDLVFVCDRRAPVIPPQPPRWLIPVQETYVIDNDLAAVLLPGLEPVVLSSVNIETDDGGFCWSLQATGPEELLDQLAPVAGLPARVRITVNGIDWVFAVERLARTRSFGQHRVQLQGRSVTALLGDPYMPVQTWLNDADLTAQQLMAAALEYTGVNLDWGITDWLVPAGVWSYRGTALQAILRVAEAAGAVVRSHRTEAGLIIAPSYPSMPWEWAAAPVAVEMPADVITTDSLEPDARAPYNAVYVSGTTHGPQGHVCRTGTAGDLLAPPVTDALITHETAARMRGRTVLGGAGAKLQHSLTMPLLVGAGLPGVITPGQLLKVNDIGHTWRGLVRSVRIAAQASSEVIVVRQALTVERNA